MVGRITSLNAGRHTGSNEAKPPVSAPDLASTGQTSGRNASRHASKENMTRHLPKTSPLANTVGEI